MSTLKVDTVRPVTTDGNLTLQGDSSGSGVSGITIDSSGKVGIGTGSPAQKLDVSGDIKFGTSASRNLLGDIGTTELYLINYNSATIRFHVGGGTSGDEKLRIDSSGNVGAAKFTDLAGTGAPDFPNGLTGLVFSKTSTSSLYTHSGSGSAANVYEEINSSFNFSISLPAGTTVLVIGSSGEFFSDSGRCFFKYEVSDGTTTTIVENATLTTNQTMTVSAQLKHVVGGTGTKTVTGKAYYRSANAGANVYFDNRATVAGPFCVSLLKYTESL